MNFWKLLSDARFTCSPSKLTEDDVEKMANTVGLSQHEAEVGALWIEGLSGPGGIKKTERPEGGGRSGYREMN
jgi:hypothetical protein